MILLIIFLCVLSVYVVKIIVQLFDFLKKVSSIPTAPHASRIPLVGHLPILFKIYRENNLTASSAVFSFIKQVHKESPEITRIGVFKILLGPIPFIAVTCPEFAELLLKRPHLPKSFLYRALEIGINGLITLNGEKYRYHKRLLTPAFDVHILQTLPSIVHKRVMLMMKEIKEAVETKDGIIDDISLLAAKMAGFIILDSSGAGIDVGSLVENYDVDSILHDWNITKTFVSDRFIQPWLLFDSLLPFFEYGRRASAAMQRMLSLGDKGFSLLRESLRQKEQQSKLDERKFRTYLEIMVRENEKNPETFTKEDVMGELRTFIATGFDSLSTALTWLLHYLGHNTRVQEKIMLELQEVFGDSDRPATLQDLKRLKYLEAVFKEGLRIVPPVPVIVRDADQDIHLSDDIVIPNHAPVFIFPYFVHRDPRHWPEPEKFLPERFLGPQDNNNLSDHTDPERRHPLAFMPFSAGSRICIGSKYATIESLGVLSTILRRFKIRSLNPTGSIRSNLQITFGPVDPITLQFIPV